MDFLALVKRLAFETGTELEANITSVAIPPATAYGETTEHRSRLVQWIKEAWIDIQEDQNQWNFMVVRETLDIVQSQLVYDLPAMVDAKEGSTVFDYLVPFVATSEPRYIWLVDGSGAPPTRNKCYYQIPEQFFGERDRYNDVSVGTPYRYSIDRGGCLVFDSTPQHNNFKIEFEYKTLPHELVGDADVPLRLPPKHHVLLVYHAMTFFAGFDESDAQWRRANKLRRDKMNKLRRDQLKEYSMSGAGV